MTSDPDRPNLDETPPHAADAPRATAPGAETSEAPRPHRLFRRRDEQMIAGVAGGMADYFDLDPSLVRIAWVAVAIVTSGLGIIVYLAMAVIVPEEGALEGATGAPQSPRREHRDRGPWGGVILGTILIIVGGIALLSQLDLPVPPWRGILAGALILAGVGILVGARRGLNGGLVVLAVLLTLLLSTSTRVPLGIVDSGFGDRNVLLDRPDQLERDYGHAFGAMRIELTDAALPDGTTRLDASIAFGDLRITVPPGVGVRVNATTAFGSTRVLDSELGAFGEREYVTPGYQQATKRLELDVNTAFGSTRVMRGQP
jgi:phage shock protein PspC (stress-responsive transcriptional regulator)